MACCSSGESVWSLCAADERLGVRPGLGPPVDRADDQAVAVVVEQRRREREPPAHVAERVVAHDRDVPHRPRVDRALVGRPGRRGQPADPAAERPQPGRARRAGAAGTGRQRRPRRRRPPRRFQLPGGHRCPSRDGGQGRVQATRTSLHDMDRAELESLLRDVAAGGVAVEAALTRLADGPMNGVARPRLRPRRHPPRRAHRRPRGRVRRRQVAGADRRDPARARRPARRPARTRHPGARPRPWPPSGPPSRTRWSTRRLQPSPSARCPSRAARCASSPPARPTARWPPRRRSSRGPSAPGCNASTTSASPACTG